MYIRVMDREMDELADLFSQLSLGESEMDQLAALFGRMSLDDRPVYPGPPPIHLVATVWGVFIVCSTLPVIIHLIILF